jgi:hypothetical protein
MLQRLSLERLIHTAEINDIEGTKCAQRFEIVSDPLHQRAGNSPWAENPDVDIGAPIRNSGRFGSEQKQVVHVRIEKLPQRSPYSSAQGTATQCGLR